MKTGVFLLHLQKWIMDGLYPSHSLAPKTCSVSSEIPPALRGWLLGVRSDNQGDHTQKDNVSYFCSHLFPRLSVVGRMAFQPHQAPSKLS